MDPILRYAERFCAAVIDHSQRYRLNMTVLAVDLGGHLIALSRMDGASYITIEAARRKAIAAAAMRVPTSSLVHLTEIDPLVATALQQGAGTLLVHGGFPMIVDGNCHGGFGISGGHYQEDEMVGQKAFEFLRESQEVLA